MNDDPKCVFAVDDAQSSACREMEEKHIISDAEAAGWVCVQKVKSPNAELHTGTMLHNEHFYKTSPVT